MSSGRSKKKNHKKIKSHRQVEALKQTVQSSPVRTELSPYNRDYVELMPATVLNTPNQAAPNQNRAAVQHRPLQPNRNAAVVAPHLVIARAVTAVVGRHLPRKPKHWLRTIAIVLVGSLAGLAAFHWHQPIKAASILAFERVSEFTNDGLAAVRSRFDKDSDPQQIQKSEPRTTVKKSIKSNNAKSVQKPTLKQTNSSDKARKAKPGKSKSSAVKKSAAR